MLVLAMKGGGMGNEATGDRDKWAALAKDMRGRLKLRGVLVQMAERGQILELRCEMPKCLCPKGRRHFDPKSNPMPAWAPNPDHYPKLKMDGGTLTPGNIRLAHVRCNNNDFGWRTRIRPMLARAMSLKDIAAALNRKKVAGPHGQAEWNERNVRKAYVS
jgi:hypothetical protein